MFQSCISSKNLNCRPSEQSRPSNAFFTKFKASVKGLFVQKEMEIVEVHETSSAVQPFNQSARHHYVLNITAVMDAEVLKGLHDIYNALHDPSILDARRHQRYNLYPLLISVVAETPSPVSLNDILDILRPRCRRTQIIYEIPALTILTSSLTPARALVPAITGSESETVSPTTVSDEPRVMSAKDFQILRYLGEGTSGKVYYVRDRVSRAKVALKVVSKASKNDYTLSIVLLEREISERLSDSPWFVNLWASWHDNANLYIAMTAYPTDLDSEMIRCNVIEPQRARFYMAEIIIALTELHSRGIIHRDVKSPNILIDREGHIVLADFGLSKDFGERPTIAERVYQPYWPYLRDENATSETEPRDPEELFFVAWDYRGSELEMAPEVHMRQPYSFGVDFWSAAIVLFWMLTGRPPFYDYEEEYEDEGEEDVKPLACKIAEDPIYWDPTDNVDDDTIDFIERMLTKNPKKRLMISYEMPSHPYFAGVNWTLMEERKVPPPWVPQSEISHVYEPTTPNFEPGTLYENQDSDPYPEFNYISEEAKIRFSTPHNEYDSDDDESDDDCDTVTDVEILRIGSYEDLSFHRQPSSTPTTPDRCDHHLGINMEKSDPVIDDTSAQQGWDVTVISRPAIKPCGPGPKLWLQPQDLARLNSFLALPSQPTISAPPVAPLFSLANPVIGVDVKPHHPTPSEHCAEIAAITSPSQSDIVSVNNTGIMHRLKTWLSHLWTFN